MLCLYWRALNKNESRYKFSWTQNIPKSWEKINFIALLQCKKKMGLKKAEVYEDNKGLKKAEVWNGSILCRCFYFFVPGFWPYSYPFF